MAKLAFRCRPQDLGKFERNLARTLGTEIASGQRRVAPRVVAMLTEASAGIKDLGDFQKGWRARPRFNTLDVWNVEAHAIFVEGTDETAPYARRPGRRPPPMAAIRPWVIRHFGDDRLTFVVARNIGIRGILARPVLRDPQMRSRISDLITREAARALEIAIVKSAR